MNSTLFRRLAPRALVAGVICALVVLTGSLGLAAEKFANLKVMPKSTTKDQMKKVMKAQSEALGVDCDFCHDENDMASDKNDHKQIARQMMKMTKEINSKWFGKDKGAEFVTCAMCHRGKPEPPDYKPTPKPSSADDGGKPDANRPESTRPEPLEKP